MRPASFASTASGLPSTGAPAQRVDDGHEPVTLRRRGIQELLARRRLGQAG